MDRASLQHDLDQLAARGRRVLVRWHLLRDLRLASRHALAWLIVVPIILFLVQAGLVVLSRPALTWRLWMAIALSAGGPVLFVAARVAWRMVRRRIDRHAALELYDRQMEARDRLVTADDFLTAVDRATNPRTREFMEAAIADAVPYVHTALATPLDWRPLPPWHTSRRSWLAVPAAAALLVAAAWIAMLPRGADAIDSASESIALARLDTRPAALTSKRQDQSHPRPEHRARPDIADSSDAPPSDVASRSTAGTRDADGGSHGAGQASSRSSSNAASSSGTPSNQRTPSKATSDDEADEELRSGTRRPQKPPERRMPEEQRATAAASGQGQSSSSSSETHNIPSDDRPDRAGTQKDEDSDQDAEPDEVEEEKTSGVERPSLRRNKPPVNRNLSPQPTGDQQDPFANGRSGPGGRKKTRGVPAMILGVPIPDRIHGMTNPGRSKVTQESATPKEEPQSSRTAEQRAARAAAFGHIQHPQLRPWMQRLIERYFMQLRQEEGRP